MRTIKTLLAGCTIISITSWCETDAKLVKTEEKVVKTEIIDPQGEQLQAAQKAYQVGNHAESVAILEELLSKHPELADGHRLLGHAYRAMDKPKKARNALGQAASLGRMTPDVLSALMQLDMDAGRDDAALAGARAILLIEPENESAIRYAIAAMQRRGYHTEVETLLRRLLEKHPKDADLTATLGTTLAAAGRTSEGRRLLEKAWLLGSSHPQIPINLAAAHQQKGNHQLALEWLNRCAEPKTTKEKRDRALQTAYLLEAAGNFTAAHQKLSTLVDNGPNQIQAIEAYLSTAPHYNDAIFALAKTHRKSLSPSILTGLANQALRSDDLPLAHTFFSAADQQSPLTGHDLLLYADVELRLRSADSARPLLVRMLAESGLTEHTTNMLHQLHALQSK